MIISLYVINWTERERGWGPRPAGKTYHLSKESADKYIEDYWATMPDKPIPDYYISPSEPRLEEVSEEIYYKINKCV